ncbi:hypothetical protein Tco_0581285 [Tanacetum coccineum]
MFQICPKVPGHKFVDPPFEEEILVFMSDLGYPGNIKSLSGVKVEIIPQLWRTFRTIINKCLSGKVTGLDLLRLSRTQILWGMYHQKNVDYVYFLWEDLVSRRQASATKTKIKYFNLPTKDNEAPKPSSGKRVKATAKVEKSGNKNQPALGLETLSDIALTEVEQRKLAIERSKIELHISQPSGSGAHEGTGVTPGVPDVPTHESDDEQISWKSIEEEDDDEREGITQDEEVNEEDSFDPRVQTPSHVESTDDEDSDDEIHDANVEGDKMNEKETYADDEANMLYGDVNINLEGRGTVMTDATLPNVQATQETEDTHVILTALINPEGQQQSSSVSSGFISNMLNPRPDTVSSIPGIVDAYLANKMHEAVKSLFITINKLRDEALAENKAFLNSLDDNIKKIIKDQVKQEVKAQVSKILPKIEKTVNEQLKAEVMTRSSTESKTSLAIAANLSILELKKILIKKMESNKRIDDEDKDEEPSTRSNRGSKRRQTRKEPESTSAPKEKTSKTTDKLTDGSKSQHKSAGESAHTEEPMHTNKDLEEPTHQEFNIGATEEQSDEETSQHPDWFQKLAKIPTPDRDWNKTLPAIHGPVQPWQPRIDRLATYPEGQQYPHDLRKPLPLIPNSRGRQVIPFDHFINNDLAYLSGGKSQPEFARDVYSKRRIIAVTKLQIVEWHGYKHLDWITVRRDDDKL